MILDSGKPRRVFINQPSKSQLLHSFHGKVGIAIPNKGKNCYVYFTDGIIYSMRVPKDCLSLKFYNQDGR